MNFYWVSVTIFGAVIFAGALLAGASLFAAIGAVLILVALAAYEP